MRQIDPLLRKALAELVGVFVFFFIGIGAIVANPNAVPGSGLLIVAAAHGLALAIMISGLGAISGGHFNPAVTFGLFVGRQVDLRTLVVYWAAQLIGGILAALAIVAVFPKSAWNPSHVGLPVLSAGTSVGTGIALEAILTFFLVLAVFGTAVDPRHPPIGGFGVGLTVFIDILVGGNITGASMNPARTFGPALVSNTWTDHAVYWIGPLIGGAVAGALYYYLFWPETTAQPVGPGTALEPGMVRSSPRPDEVGRGGGRKAPGRRR